MWGEDVVKGKNESAHGVGHVRSPGAEQVLYDLTLALRGAAATVPGTSRAPAVPALAVRKRRREIFAVISRLHGDLCDAVELGNQALALCADAAGGDAENLEQVEHAGELAVIEPVDG